jgi:hypothetical protein
LFDATEFLNPLHPALWQSFGHDQQVDIRLRVRCAPTDGAESLAITLNACLDQGIDCLLQGSFPRFRRKCRIQQPVTL